MLYEEGDDWVALLLPIQLIIDFFAHLIYASNILQCRMNPCNAYDVINVSVCVCVCLSVCFCVQKYWSSVQRFLSILSQSHFLFVLRQTHELRRNTNYFAYQTTKKNKDRFLINITGCLWRKRKHEFSNNGFMYYLRI